MAGSRPLTETEQRRLLRIARQLSPIRRALLTAEIFGGFRISETLALRVRHVVDRRGAIVNRIGLEPSRLKGRRGSTRWVPVGPELRRALESCVRHLGRQGPLDPNLPLFPSRQRGPNGEVRPLGRSAAEKFIKEILMRIADQDLQGLSTHSLRKSWALRLWIASGKDILAVRDGLSHSSVEISQDYLSVDRTRVDECILAGDWTRRPCRIEPTQQIKGLARPAVEVGPTAVRVKGKNPLSSGDLSAPNQTGWLPGFEVAV